MEIPISNSLAPTEIVRVPRRFAVIYCHSLPTFWVHKGRRYLACRIRIHGTIVPLTRANQGPCRDPPKVATRGNPMLLSGSGAVSRLCLKNALCVRAFTVARPPNFVAMVR